MRTSRKILAIDRIVPGIGRITIRTKRMSTDARNDLNRAITRAVQAGHLEQLRLLKARKVKPLEFLEASRLNRLPALRPSLPVRPLVEQWLWESDLREASRRRYVQSWRFLFAPLPLHATVDALDAAWWSAFIGTRHVSPATLNRDRAALLAFLNWAKIKGHAVPDCGSARRIEEPKKSHILTVEQIEAIRRTCRPDRWPFFWFLLETGARQGEILNLQAEDIVEGLGLVIFRSQPGSKSRGKDRRVPISPELASCARMLGIVNSGRIFPVARTTVREWWTEICVATAIRGVTLHGIRATFITMALDDGVPPAQVQKLVGHSDISITMGYYRDVGQSMAAGVRIRSAMGLGETISNQAIPSVSPSPAALLEVS